MSGTVHQIVNGFVIMDPLEVLDWEAMASIEFPADRSVRSMASWVTWILDSDVDNITKIFVEAEFGYLAKLYE